MALEVGGIYQDMLNISKETKEAESWKYVVEVIVDGVAKPVLNLNKYRVEMQPVKEGQYRFRDIKILVVTVTKTMYRKFMYPNKEKLKVKITRQKKASHILEDIVENQEFVYRALLADNEDMDLLNKGVPEEYVQDEENLQSTEVVLQLIDPIALEIEHATTGGVWRNNTMQEILRDAMSYDLGESKPTNQLTAKSFDRIRGVDVVLPSNQKVYRQLIIPVGTRIVDVPNYLQQEEGGVYTTGVGAYLQDGLWYIYPMLDFNRVREDKRRLVIVSLPENEVPQLEKSYIQDGKTTIIATTGVLDIDDNTESSFINDGVGITYVPASAIMSKMIDVTDTDTKSRYNETVKNIAIEKRDDDYNPSTFANNTITNNPFKELEKKASSLGRVITLVWKISNHSLLYPGMPVNIIYVKDGMPTNINGILISHITEISTRKQVITENDYFSNTQLEVFIPKHS